ncbi:MAG: BREX protein BrxB domain-containing protein [Dehalococcoidia bacterium]
MRPLPEKFDEVEDLLLHHRETLAQNTGVPFIRLVYHPEDEETECRRRRELLERTLRREGVPVEVVSCRGAIFVHYEQRGRLNQLFELEKTESDRLNASIGRYARRELTNRLLAAAERLNGNGVIFLVDVAFVHPYFHLTPVLDDCTNRIAPPLALVVFYPGEVGVDGQLLFLGVRPSGYYRTRDLI